MIDEISYCSIPCYSGCRELVKLDTFTITEQRCNGILANTRFCWVVMDYNKASRDSLRISGFTAKQLFALAMEKSVSVCVRDLAANTCDLSL